MSAVIDEFDFKPRSTTKRDADQFGFMERGTPQKKESPIKSGLRTAYQPVAGYLKQFTYPMDLLEMGGKGYALDPEEIEHLRKIYEREGIPFDEDEYRQQVEEASKYFPTQGNIEREVEDRTGIPLEAKTGFQKALRMGSTAASLTPGAFTQKAVAGVAAPIGKKGLQKLGVPEPAAEMGGYILSGGAAAITPKGSITKSTKPSGLTTRQFEKLEKPTKVSPGRYEKINEKLEGDFKKISDEIFEKSPSFEEIKSDPVGYTEKLNQGFEAIENLASEIKQPIPNRQLTSFMVRRMNTHMREMKGIIPSESELAFRQEFAKLANETAKGKKPFTIQQTVEQFRKNNKQLADYFEPGKSKGFNKGKRDALLEYNRSIEELYETVFPDSEFTKLFKEQNQKWSRLKDYDFVGEQLEKIFDKDKINFKDISKVLDKQNANFRRPFERTLGKEGFKDFEQLIKDFKSVENPYSLLKRADNAGFGDLAKLAGQFLLHPSLGKLKVATGLTKDAFKALLDKPQLSLTWKKAIDDLKGGKFAESENGFNKLSEEAQATAEKTSKFSGKARTLPQGFSEPIAEKVLEVNPRFEEMIPEQILKKNNIKEPTELINQGATFAKPTKLDKITYKHSWPTLMDAHAFEKYYTQTGGGHTKLGTAGELIKNPKIKQIYKDVLDTPIVIEPLGIHRHGTYNPKHKYIRVNENLSPQDLYSTIIHELHHALQDKKGRLEKLGIGGGKSFGEYLKHPTEVKARLAQRHATKDIQKYRKTHEKIKKYKKDKPLKKKSSGVYGGDFID